MTHFHSSPEVIIFQQISTKVVFHLVSALMSYTFSASHLHNLTYITILVKTIIHIVIYLIIYTTCLYDLFLLEYFLPCSVSKYSRISALSATQCILGNFVRTIFLTWKFLFTTNLISNKIENYIVFRF
jgi:hypothetical protein